MVIILPLLLPQLLLPQPAHADDALIAVAANFVETLEALTPPFADRTGHELRFVTGGAGALYAQIASGAPFDLFLSADAARPARLEAEGPGVVGTRFTYATGRLALWSADPDRISDETALDAPFRRLALADPGVAPYGAAARQALQALGRWKAIAPRLANARNVGQAFAMTAAGAAELGFVAWPQARGAGGSVWRVPVALHDPIRQDAILLRAGADNRAARDFLDWLRGDAAQAIIRAHGYEAGR